MPSEQGSEGAHATSRRPSLRSVSKVTTRVSWELSRLLRGTPDFDAAEHTIQISATPGSPPICAQLHTSGTPRIVSTMSPCRAAAASPRHGHAPGILLAYLLLLCLVELKPRTVSGASSLMLDHDARVFECVLNSTPTANQTGLGAAAIRAVNAFCRRATRRRRRGPAPMHQEYRVSAVCV